MAEVDEGTSEINVASEIPRDNWQTLIIIQRHTRYDSDEPVDLSNITENERDTLGKVTPEGAQETKEVTKERVNVILNQNPNTDFLIMGSPTYWMDNPQLGQRALETGELITEEIAQELRDKKLSENQLLNTFPQFKGEKIRPDDKLIIGQAFRSPEFIALMDEAFAEDGEEGDKWWQAYYKDELAEKRQALGAEGPIDIANRINRRVEVSARFAEKYHKLYPDRRLVIWMVTHGDCLETYSQRFLGIPVDYAFSYNQAVGIAINPQGAASARIEDTEYPLLKSTNGPTSTS